MLNLVIFRCLTEAFRTLQCYAESKIEYIINYLVNDELSSIDFIIILNLSQLVNYLDD